MKLIKKLIFKLSMLILVLMLFVGSILFFFLYYSIVNERIESETQNLLSRGSSHRDVLENYFNTSTIHHVVLMESEALTSVVITDENYNIIESSNTVDDAIHEVIKSGNSYTYSHHGQVLEASWRTEPYLATVSPIYIEDTVKGYVFMFLDTKVIKTMIESLTKQFILVGLFATFLLFITSFFLSKFITSPLKKMKLVTERLSEGTNDLLLDIQREDELGDLARSIQKLSDDLERMKKERHEFLASISHELRTPLTYITGYADILKRPNLSIEDREKYLSIVQEEVSNVTGLIKDLFELAKMDQNQFEIQKEDVQIGKFLERIISKMLIVYEKKGVELEFYCNSNSHVCIDPKRFEQVIINILDNALKYSPPKTTVKVHVLSKENDVIIDISDKGEGIPQKDLPHIWDRLYRVDKSRSRATGGSGLGLTIAKEIIEKHDGRVEVMSIVGVGTTFKIYIKEGSHIG